ncbi:hypothetical protein E2C01_028176 [Portunus trituberculatus]|uniref:Uncharacterized protein n=1 Tax=Portunus trituberculatus TaxID=210409 RepID=A0A5B7EMX8_PORTR|nr:hypothetical protein [Portunus trituberculatus]
MPGTESMCTSSPSVPRYGMKSWPTVPLTLSPSLLVFLSPCLPAFLLTSLPCSQSSDSLPCTGRGRQATVLTLP